MPLILVHERQREKDQDFKASLGYITRLRLTWAT